MARNTKQKGPVVVVSALILVNPAGEVLLARRPPGKSMAGLWEFPGGKVGPGEGLKAALVREIREELGIKVEPEALVLALTVHHDYADFRLEMAIFIARAWEGDIRPLEGQALAWVKPGNLGRYPMPPADLPVIEKLPEILKIL